jgi:hypothetical protein
MEDCCGAKTVFDHVTASPPPVTTEATPYGPRFDFDDRRSAGIDAHLARKSGASIDFEDVSTRTFAFSSSRPARQDLRISQMYPTLVTHLGGESDWLGW